MEVFQLLVFGLIGLSIGSFLNVVADRLPAGQSLIRPPSHCPGCGCQIRWSELIPVLSYILLRGRCRTCGMAIPRRVPVVEAITGCIFVFFLYYYGFTTMALVNIFYFCLFIILMVIDLETGIIPNVIVYPASLIAIFISSFIPSIGILNAFAGGGVGLAIFLTIAVISRGGMGTGDVKMAALIGLVTGFPLVLVDLLLAVVMGGLTAALLLLLRLKKAKEGIPFGPFLSLATMITLLWGREILNWYLNLYGF
jgi:leader peptidase (prepilin peptidase)/N-methyltransferase